jgi:uncharacterized membrane protein YidH (DUF202 family)
MNRRQAALTLAMVFLVLVGMVGLYYGLWRAWQLYQQKSAQLSTPSGILGLLTGKSP